MQRRKMMSGLFVGAVAAMLATPVLAQARYRFTRIADSTAFGELREPVALNDRGQVSFVTTLPTGVTGVFVGSGGAVTGVADDFSGLQHVRRSRYRWARTGDVLRQQDRSLGVLCRRQRRHPPHRESRRGPGFRR